MKKVLIAIDRHPSAEIIAETGYAVAKSMHAEVILAHVITEPGYYPENYIDEESYAVVNSLDNLKELVKIRRNTIDFLSGLALHLGDPGIAKKALTGEIEKSIARYCRKRNIDLLVVGAHHRKGIKGLMVVDVAEHLLKNAEIPMLIIPTHNHRLKNVS